MALISLIATGSLENSLGITNKRAMKPFELNFVNKRLIVERSGDLFNLQSIQFRNVSDNFEFKQLCLDIGGSNILTLDSSLMSLHRKSKYNSYEEEMNIDNQRILTFNIPWKELGYQDLLKLISLQYHEVRVRIDYQGTCNNSVALCYYSYLDTTERSQMAQSSHESFLFQLQKQNFIQQNNTQTHTLLFNGIINGLFIIGLNYSSISELEILLNGHTRLKLNQYNLPYLVNRLSESTFYLPFDGNFDFNNTDLAYGTNFSRIDNVSLKITTQNIIAPIDFQVGVKTVNLLRMMSGMAGLDFAYGNISSSPVSIQEFEIENKVISGDTLCPVNYEEITENDEYLNCGKCHKNFLLNVVQQWVQEKKKCPMCRQQWINWKIYKNIN